MGKKFHLGVRKKNEERKRRALKRAIAAAVKTRECVSLLKISFPLECYRSSPVSSLSLLQHRIKAMKILPQGVSFTTSRSIISA